MAITLSQRPILSANDVDVFALDYTDYLDSGELLTGSVTVAEQVTSDLTIANNAVSTGSLTILGRTVATGMAVQFKVSGQLAGVTYRVRVTVSTDATIARTKVVDVIFPTAADS